MTAMDHPPTKAVSIAADEKNIIIPGPAGNLEAILGSPPHQSEIKKHQINYLGIVCHPHPLYQGTMNNKVVTTTARAFRERGAYSLRFNFRGVGASAGRFGQVTGEIDDLLAVIQWVQQQEIVENIILAGFSFGANIAARVAQSATTRVQGKGIAYKQLICIAPPVVHFNMAEMTNFPMPVIILVGDVDEVITVSAVTEWAQSLKPPAQYVVFKNTGHFFHGELLKLRQAVADALLIT